MKPDCTFIIAHYRTPILLRTAVESLRKVYPEVDLVVVDNGSGDESVAYLQSLEVEDRHLSVLYLDSNQFHGPALDVAVKRCVSTEYFFTLDSDTKTIKGGFLEEMIRLLKESAQAYSCGRRIVVNLRGFPAKNGGVELCWVPYALFSRRKYLVLPPFAHHGVPNLANAVGAMQSGFEIISFPIEDYIDHLGRGTVERFGYGLGMRGFVNRMLNSLGI